MKRLLIVLLLLIVGVVVLGHYREWFKVTTTSESKTITVNLILDKEKMQEDRQKATEKLQTVGGQLKEKAASFTDKKGGDGKDAADAPQSREEQNNHNRGTAP
jgi:hypothetical protein